MKTWHKVALVVLNLALLPVTVPFVMRPSTTWPPILQFGMQLPVLHMAITAVAVNGYVLWRKWRRRGSGVTSPDSQHP